VFITLEDFSLWSSPPMATTKETIDMVTNQFPERLGHCVMFKAPMIFGGLWSAVKGFIDPKTAGKVSSDISVLKYPF
jgi:hypothetical protein